MINNPFTSTIFSGLWAKHFNQSAPGVHFGFVKDLLFIKHRFLPYYFNCGKTHTKGINYSLENSNIDEMKGKVLLIYDVPAYFNLPRVEHKKVKQYNVKQYPGFLINLAPYKDLDEYMVATFKKSSRYKLKKYRKKLETCFDISYKMFYGEISKEEYDLVFQSFRNLLVKRFDDKQISNNNLEKQEWDFYQEVAYPMILEKKAGLFVIYNGNQPIGVTLNYFSEDVLFDAITVFDIDYSKFHLGSITIMGLISWCIENKLNTFDFSKGYFDYKKRWATKEYVFEYHIMYDSKSIMARLLAFSIKFFFQTKQFLRDKNVNDRLHKLTYKLRKKKTTVTENRQYGFHELGDDQQTENLVEVNWRTAENNFLKTPIFDFLYVNNESSDNLKVYTNNENPNQFSLFGVDKKSILKIGAA